MNQNQVEVIEYEEVEAFTPPPPKSARPVKVSKRAIKSAAVPSKLQNSSINNSTENNNSELPLCEVQNDKFVMDEYLKRMEIIIQNILLRPENNVLSYDILDTEKTIKNKLIVLKEKQRQMKIGEIWQEMIGNYDEFINLKIGHETGLDILSKPRKLAIELKNRTNTDNASSRKSNLDKLAQFKRLNPEYKCIYANINDDTEVKTYQGSNKKIIHNGVEIVQLVGYQLLNLIFGEKTEEIIEFIKDTIDKYT